jgi:hypothetical protein
MKTKQKDLIYLITGANVYYNKQKKSWCALWLDKGFEHKIWFSKGIDIDTLCNLIINKQKAI